MFQLHITNARGMFERSFLRTRRKLGRWRRVFWVQLEPCFHRQILRPYLYSTRNVIPACVFPAVGTPFEVCTRQNEGLTDPVRKPQRLIRGIIFSHEIF